MLHNISDRRGVYSIINTISGKLYVGSTTGNFSDRWSVHRVQLNRGTHCNRHLQGAWTMYGSTNFRFDIIDECEPEFALIREQHWIDTLKPQYNIAPIAGTPRGYRHTEEAKRKISLARKGKKLSETHKQNLRGKTRSYEHRKRLSESLKGNKNCLGRKASPETRLKLSISHRGPRPKGHRHSAETIEKMSQAKYKYHAARRLIGTVS